MSGSYDGDDTQSEIIFTLNTSRDDGDDNVISFDGDSHDQQYAAVSSPRDGASTILAGSDISSEWKSSVVHPTLDGRIAPLKGKLRFSSLGLYGRDKERKILQDCLERAISLPLETLNEAKPPAVSSSSTSRKDHSIEAQTVESISAQTPPSPAVATVLSVASQESPGSPKGSNHSDTSGKETMTKKSSNSSDGSSRITSRQLVFISGSAGSGKTALASTVMPIVRRWNGAYARGKYDVYLRDEPYAGIASACRELCGEILSLQDVSRRRTSSRRPASSSSSSSTRLLAVPGSSHQDIGPRDDSSSRPVSSSSLLPSSSRSILQHLPPSERVSLHETPSPRQQERHKRDFSLEEIRSAIIEQLGSELPLLTQVIPHLEEIVGSTTMTRTTTATTNDPSGGGSNDDKATGGDGVFEATNRLHYAFRRFIRIVAKFFNPLVILLDDLQWADLASLDLLEVLISDQETTSLMILCNYRAANKNGDTIDKDDTDHHHSVVVRAIDDLKSRYQETKDFEFTEIEVGNLAIPDVEQMILDVLGVSDQSHTISLEPNSTNKDRVLELAHILHKKTHGNVFFLLQFLSALYQQGLLAYNVERREWNWDKTEIENKTLATENVVDLMKSKIADLSNEACQLLQLAACLSSTFDERMLSLVWDDFCRSNNNKNTDRNQNLIEDAVGISQLLASTVDKGLLEVVHNGSDLSSKKYRWCHDKIQESAFALIPQAEVMDLQARVGLVLVEQLTEQELEMEIFVAVSLLNDGSAPVSPSRRIRLTELNLQAARKAVRFSAFKSALTFATKGVELLPTNRWKRHYELALELYTIAAESELFLGDYENMEFHCREVLAQDLSLFDKLPLYNVLIMGTYRREHVQAAVETCLVVLKQLGCKLPSSKVFKTLATAVGIVRIKATIKSRTPEEISQLPIITDWKKGEAIKFLDTLANISFGEGDPLIPLLAVFKRLQWTIKYGVCPYSPPAFSAVGVILVGVLSDFQGGAMYGKHALLLAEKFNSKIVEARTSMTVHAFILPWTKPCYWVLKPLLRVYELAMHSGDTLIAMAAIFFYICHGFYSGRRLSLLEIDCRIYSHQAREFKLEKPMYNILVLHQAILNLMGHSENRAILTGEVMNQNEYMQRDANDQDPQIWAMLNVHQIQLYAFFEEYELGADLAIAMGDKMVKEMPASPFLLVDPFFKGISAFAMARKTGRGKYRKLAKKSLRTLKDWMGKGNPNTIHLHSFLEGELSALQGKAHLATTHYEAAAGLAARGDYLPHAALIHRRYGEFLLWDMSLPEEAAVQLQKAVRIFVEWEGQALADMILKKYAELWPRPIEIVTFSADDETPGATLFGNH